MRLQRGVRDSTMPAKHGSGRRTTIPTGWLFRPPTKSDACTARSPSSAAAVGEMELLDLDSLLHDPRKQNAQTLRGATKALVSGDEIGPEGVSVGMIQSTGFDPRASAAGTHGKAKLCPSDAPNARARIGTCRNRRRNNVSQTTPC